MSDLADRRVPQESRRVMALDLAKGTAIAFVVIGHVVSRNNYAPGAEWYLDFRALIYLFHMPLFMALSGMALGLSWRHRAALLQVARFVGLRVRQLMVPFLVFAILVVAGKLVVARWISVDNQPAGFVQGLASIVLTPMKSPSAFLWYIQVLATYYLTVPWLMQLNVRWAPVALLLMGVTLQGQAYPTILNLDFCIEYLPFFAAGLLIGQHWFWLQSRVLAQRAWPVWGLIFAIALVISHVHEPLPKWLVGAVSIPFVLTVHQRVHPTVARLLAFLGSQTLSIYLMNTICIGLAKALLKPVVPYQGQYFYIYLAVLTVAGLAMPILVKDALVRWRPGLRQYL